MNLKMRVKPVFPANVVGDGPVSVVKENGTYRLGWDPSALADTSPPSGDHPDDFFVYWNRQTRRSATISMSEIVALLSGAVIPSPTIVTTGTTVTVSATDQVIVLNKSVASATNIVLPAIASRSPAGAPLEIYDFAGTGGPLTVTPNGTELVMGVNGPLTIASGGTQTGSAARLIPSSDLSGWTVELSGVNASNLLFGTAALAVGGTGADLSATGGAHNVLMQTGAGLPVTVAQLAASDISGLAPSAATDTTNAANITSGTLPNARLSAIPNSALANSAVTISGHSLSLGGTLSLSYGDISGIGYFATGTDAANLTGTIANARFSGTYSNITGTGTLTAGATGAGFTVNLGTSTMFGTLPNTNLPAAATTITSVGTLTGLTVSAAPRVTVSSLYNKVVGRDGSGNELSSGLATAATYGVPSDGVTSSATPITNYAASGAAELVFTAGTYLIDADTTIPAGTVVRMVGGAQFKIADGHSLTIRGKLIAPQYKVFVFGTGTGTGTVLGLRDVDVAWFGVTPSASGANNSAWLAKVSACIQDGSIIDSDGGYTTVRFGAGTYTLASTWTLLPATNNTFKIVGAGMYPGGTVLQTASGVDMTLVQITGAHDCEFEWHGITFERSGTSSGVAAISTGVKFNAAGAGGATTAIVENLFSKCQFVGFSNGVLAYRLAYALFDRCVFVLPNSTSAAYGAHMISEASTDAVKGPDVVKFHHCHWRGTSGNTIAKAVYLDGGDGGNLAAHQLVGCEFLAIDNAIYVTGGGSATFGDIWVDRCQFDTAAGRAMDVVMSDTAAFGDLHFTNNYGTACGDAFISLNNTGSGGISGCFITGNITAGVSGRAVQTFNCQGLVIANNIFSGVGSSDGAIYLQGTNYSTVTGNSAGPWGGAGSFVNFVRLNNACTGNVVVGNNASGQNSGASADITTGVTGTNNVANNY